VGGAVRYRQGQVVKGMGQGQGGRLELGARAGCEGETIQ
jgi:hypothetical protein